MLIVFFQIELQIDGMADVKGIRRDLSAIKDGVLDQRQSVSVIYSFTGKCLPCRRFNQGQRQRAQLVRNLTIQ